MTLAWTGSSTPVGGEEATTMNSIAGSGCRLGGGGGDCKYQNVGQHRFTITILQPCGPRRVHGGECST